MAAGDLITISENAHGHKANYYDGADDYMLVDAHAVARVAANDTTGTYSAWIYADNIATGADQVILSAGDNNTTDEYMRLFLLATGILRIELRHGAATQFIVDQTTKSMNSKTWYHVAVTQNGTQPKLYIDGVNIAATNSTATDLTYWYDELTLTDKFAIGVLETNGTHVADFKGAIGKVKYWNKALTDDEINDDYHGTALSDDGTYLQLNLTMDEDGITDAGLGADNGTLTGHAYYGGIVSNWSYSIEKNVTGNAAEFINTEVDGDKYVTQIKRGD